MSLRAFHIIFVISVTLLFIFLSYLNYINWKNIGGNDSLSYMLFCIISSILTMFYGTKFYSRTKQLSE